MCDVFGHIHGIIHIITLYQMKPTHKHHFLLVSVVPWCCAGCGALELEFCNPVDAATLALDNDVSVHVTTSDNYLLAVDCLTLTTVAILNWITVATHHHREER